MKCYPRWWLPLGASLAATLLACQSHHSQRKIIRVEGSDTLVNVAQAWAEIYCKKHPDISVQVLGGGTGVGIASLIEGNCDLANASREMEDKERARARELGGQPPLEHVVGYDALALFVHPTNPLRSIHLGQLAEIYGEGGQLRNWGQLGVTIPGARSQGIVRVGRQNSSGTYTYFRSTVLGKNRDMALGSVDANGSKDAVALVSQTPQAIGYSGMGYLRDEVRALSLAAGAHTKPIEPTLENALNGEYPLTRPLLVYTQPQPAPEVTAYIEWMLSPPGQEILSQVGFIPENQSRSHDVKPR